MAKPAHARSSQQWINDLLAPREVDALHPIAARFIYSLRLIALYEHADRDPIPELASRLSSVEVAAKAYILVQVIGGAWPESIKISRFCCLYLSYDEATIGSMIDSAVRCDRSGFEHAIEGLVRHDRNHGLWDAVLSLVAAEMRVA